VLSTTLVEHPWLTTAALLALVVLGPLAGAWLVPRPRVASSLLTPAGVVVVLFTLLPTQRDLEVGCRVEWSLPTLGAVELMANVVLFVPVVLVAGVLTRRPLLVLGLAVAASAVIEVIQAFVTGLGRSCSTNDWLSNSLGGLLGAVLALVAIRLARWRSDS